MALKPEQVDVVLAALRSGLTVTDACVKAGISRNAFYVRLKRNRKFARSVEEGRLMSKERALLLIQTAAMKDWCAAAWFLERNWPEQYARRTFAQVEQTSRLAAEDRQDARDLRVALGLPQDASQAEVDAVITQVKKRRVQANLERLGANIISLPNAGGLTQSTSDAIDAGAAMLPAEPEEKAATS